MSKNVPTNKSLYSRVKSEAKQKFDRWPSAYGSAWLVKEYKRRGGGYRKAEQGMEVPEENFAGYMPADMDEYALGGGIPERYKNMGFNKVGVKKESNRPGKKWMVLAKKGDKYKVVHGGYKGMKDFTQHGSEKRKDRFWDRMGGRDSAKAKDPFSPLYWHKKFGTWAEGGEPQNEGFQALPPYVQAKIMANKMYGGTMYAAGGEMFNEDSQDFYQKGGWIQDARKSMEEKGTVGAFTKQARREGYDDVQEFAGYVLENPAQFTPTTKKRAQFAKNMGKLQKAMHGMELKKYQMQGQTIEELNWNANEPIRRQEALRRGEAYTPQLFQPGAIRLDEVPVYGKRIEPVTVTPKYGDMTAERIDLPSKGLAPIPIEMPKLGPMPTITAPTPAAKEDMSNNGLKQNEDGTFSFSYTGYGYEPMGSKDDPWWQRGAVIGAYAPGIIANQINSATDNRREAVARTKNNLTDYTDNVIRQGLALSRGEREMNTDQLDVVNRTPVQFENYFQDGGESFVDQSILEALIAAGADIEILD